MSRGIVFDLPKELIANSPATPRDHARLLVYDRKNKTITDEHFYNLDKYLPKNTVVVANNSKVEHCRYLFNSAKTEVFAVEKLNDRTVRALVRPGKKFKLGNKAMLTDDLVCEVTAIDQDGLRTLVFNCKLDDKRLIAASHVPLPPYIKQNDELSKEYQTIYAKPLGSLAAPTAGLHFTPELKAKISKKFGWQEVTLHVGLGTFAPLKDENFATNQLHAEKYEVSESVYKKIKASPHITAVGTTSARTIESIFSDPKHPLKSETSIFIHDDYVFKRVDSLITNFHLPGTSLLLMVEAFIGSEDELQKIYAHAIKNKYRFYSFGDAMLIV
jgi:S-adenosylmethionine:tRNA ribosyltransferase-isomerase